MGGCLYSTSRVYAALGALEKQCALWLFDILVKPTRLYEIETYGPCLNKRNNWKDIERPLVSMILRMIRSKDKEQSIGVL